MQRGFTIRSMKRNATISFLTGLTASNVSRCSIVGITVAGRYNSRANQIVTPSMFT